jgi:hypothetical protein
MHSTKELTSAMFAFTIGGRPGSFAEVFPGFDQRDRLGIVSRSVGGALATSALLMAAITAFYELERARSETFFRYPDYFLFHVGASVGPYGMLDIWPEHKEVGVQAGDGEALLRAINDRAITRLLIEDGPAGVPEFARATLGSVGLRDALAFAPDGRVRDADVAVRGNTATERYVAAVIDALTPLADDERAALRARRLAILEDGVPTETFRRLTLDEALALIASPGS